MKYIIIAKKAELLEFRLRYGILRKGGFTPGCIRVWGGVKYRKFGPGDWRPLVEGKEPWDSSSEKAKELKIADFGTPEEVREMAKMPRTAKNREEAIKTLKGIEKNGALISRTGLVASLSGKSIDEIASGQALYQSFDRIAHWMAAANIDKLFSNAIEPWKFELDPHKNNENLKDRRYLYAPMEYHTRIVPVKFTIKEYKQEGIGKRLYSIEAIDVDF